VSTIKNPVAKKAKSLKKDHRLFVLEGNKSFRGLWMKKKRRLAKKERHATQRVLSKVDPRIAGDADSPKRQVARRLRKTGVATFGRVLEIKKKQPRKRFSRFRYSSGDYEKT
jgi:hypothetical protein